MSFHSLLQRKTRTILTVLGVVIGTASIVIMISLGLALDRSFKEDLAHMGNLNIIEVNSGAFGYGAEAPGGATAERAKLDDAAVASLEKIPGVEGVMPVKYASLKAVVGKMVAPIQVMGVKPEDLPIFDFQIEDGRLLSSTDKEVLIFGKQVAYNFYNPRLANRGGGPPDINAAPPVNLISDKILLTFDMEYGERRRENTDTSSQKALRLYQVKGVGILKESNSEKDYSSYMNISALEKIEAEDRKDSAGDKPRRRSEQGDKYNSIKVKAADIEQVQAVQEKIKAMGFQTFSLTDMLESMKKTSRTMQAILGGIGAVSLFVAAIGIANTMVMSIYERTREIGIIKVLGADIKDIRRLFLLEAGMIGLGGGLLGLALSYAISTILNQVAAPSFGGMGARAISVITPQLALSALAFATLVGLMAGYAPARRAMNLSPLEAIRTDL